MKIGHNNLNDNQNDNQKIRVTDYQPVTLLYVAGAALIFIVFIPLCITLFSL